MILTAGLSVPVVDFATLAIIIMMLSYHRQLKAKLLQTKKQKICCKSLVYVILDHHLHTIYLA